MSSRDVSKEYDLVVHLKNLIMSDPKLQEYLSVAEKQLSEDQMKSGWFKLIRRSQLIMIMSAVIAQLGQSQN